MKVSRKNRPYNNVTFNEKDESYTMEIALPGIGKEDLTIEIKEDLLFIKTDENEDKNQSSLNFHGKSWKYKLPQHAEIDNISAKIENGLLSIEIPLKVLRKSIKVA